jgi:hypothetical protein
MAGVRGRRAEFRDAQGAFGGGLNLAALPENLRPDELRLAENVHLDQSGGTVKRGGLQRILTGAVPGAGAPLQGGTEPRPGFVQQYVAGGRLYQFSWTEATDVNPTAEEVGTGGLSETARISFALFRDASAEMVYLADGGQLNKSDGVSSLAADIADTPSALTFIWSFNNRLCGVDAVSNTLYQSALDNGDTLGILNLGGLRSRVGGVTTTPLVAGAGIGASNILFHTNAVSRFTGWTQDDINIEAGTRGLSSDTGTIAPFSVIVVGDWVYFMTATGFYRVGEAGPLQLLSARIQPVLDAIDPAGNTSMFQYVSVMHNKKRQEIMWYLPFNNGCWCYNYALDAWTGPFTGFFNAASTSLTCMWAGTDSYARPTMFTGWTDGVVRVFERSAFGVHYTDDAIYGGTSGTDYDALTGLRRLNFRTPTRSKSMRRLFVNWQPEGSTASRAIWTTRNGGGIQALSTDAITNGSPDWDESTTEWDVSGPYDGVREELSRVQAHGKGPYVDITLSCPDNAPARFGGVEAQAFDLGERAV